MSAPFIWIILPIIIAVPLFVFRRWKRAVSLAGIFICLLLAGLAWQLPLGGVVELSPWPSVSTLRISETMSFFGRNLTLGNEDRIILIMIYLAGALWLGGALAANASPLFVPVSLMTAALLTAAISVDPFLYAAILVLFTSILCLPLLTQAGAPAGRGSVRFIAFQTLSMPFILLAGWMVGGIEGEALNEGVALRAAWMFGFGLIFALAVFPFHSWIPLVSEESHPYVASYVLFTIPTIVSLFLLTFLVQFILPVVPGMVWPAIRFLGLLMVFVGGMWCAIQNHLGRMVGFAVISEIGLILLTLSLGPGTTSMFLEPALPIFFTQILARGIAIAVWALSLSIIQAQQGGLEFRKVQGAAHHLPLAAIAAVLAQFSLAGVPLLAGFPVRLALWSSLAEINLSTAFLALAGGVGLLIGGMRTMAVLIAGDEPPRWKSTETTAQKLLLTLGCIMLFLLGIFPQWLLIPIQSMAAAFTNLP